MKYVVNFASELSEIVTETKYMEQLGFSIPELARNVALQVSIQIYIYCNERPWLKYGSEMTAVVLRPSAKKHNCCHRGTIVLTLDLNVGSIRGSFGK